MVRVRKGSGQRRGRRAAVTKGQRPHYHTACGIRPAASMRAKSPRREGPCAAAVPQALQWSSRASRLADRRGRRRWDRPAASRRGCSPRREGPSGAATRFPQSLYRASRSASSSRASKDRAVKPHASARTRTREEERRHPPRPESRLRRARHRIDGWGQRDPGNRRRAPAASLRRRRRNGEARREHRRRGIQR